MYEWLHVYAGPPAWLNNMQSMAVRSFTAPQRLHDGSSLCMFPADWQYPDGYHGYWNRDLWEVNSHFGTEADLHALVDGMHERGMLAMLDIGEAPRK